MRKKTKDPWATYIPARKPLTNRQSIIGIVIVAVGAALICAALVELSNITNLINYF